jgi:hypothetical protein
VADCDGDVLTLLPHDRPGLWRFVAVSLGMVLLVLLLSACSARQLLVQGMANELAAQGKSIIMISSTLSKLSAPRSSKVALSVIWSSVKPNSSAVRSVIVRRISSVVSFIR